MTVRDVSVQPLGFICRVNQKWVEIDSSKNFFQRKLLTPNGLELVEKKSGM